MRIVLIGFSGTGKSHWSKLLAETFGYHHICCDDLIEVKLQCYLPSDASGINDVAEWMGQPYDLRFRQNEARYLQCEIEVLDEILSKPFEYYPERTVLDTTGSVIYTGERLTQKLSDFGKVVYLEVTPAVLTEMYQQYIRDPKPVIWGNSFKQREDETSVAALERCYPELLKYRQIRYELLAEVSLGYEELRAGYFSPYEFLSAVGFGVD
jgi:shikimate kinase